MTASQISPLRYPDEGHPYGDASVLRNAVHFVTRQRAFSAHQPDNLEDFGADFLSFAAWNAYCAEMLASEDFLGWMFVLRDWKPGSAEDCLFVLHSKVEVGRGPYTEQSADGMLDALDEVGLRQLLHIPSDEELEAEGFDSDLRKAIADSVVANLGGLRRTTKYRLGND